MASDATTGKQTDNSTQGDEQKKPRYLHELPDLPNGQTYKLLGLEVDGQPVWDAEKEPDLDPQEIARRVIQATD